MTGWARILLEELSKMSSKLLMCEYHGFFFFFMFYIIVFTCAVASHTQIQRGSLINGVY